MNELEPTPGPHITRRVEQPPGYYLEPPRRTVVGLAAALAVAHNQALKVYGSDCGGSHAFDPVHGTTIGVFPAGGVYPQGSVVTSLAWGRIDTRLAQRVLELDGLA